MSSTWSRRGVAILLWLAPFLSLGPFLGLGVLFAAPKAYTLRRIALTTVLLQVVLGAFYFGIELVSRYSFSSEAVLQEALEFGGLFEKVALVSVVFGALLLFLNLVHSRQRENQRRKQRKYPHLGRWIPDSQFWVFFKVLFFTLLLTFLSLLYNESMGGKGRDKPSFGSLHALLLDYFFSLALFAFSYNRGKALSLFSRWFLNFELGNRARDRWKKDPSLGKNSQTVYLQARFRDRLLPGWGHIFLGDFWRGFPFLFVGLLLLLFTAVWLFSYISPIFGIQFLSLLGLKPGISDKDFFMLADNLFYAAFSLFLFFLHYFHSHYLLQKNFFEVQESRTKRGFQNALPTSFLVHLVFLSIVFLIPISIQRSSNKKNQQNASHFQPDSMEFYFIDPNIPDDTKGLNGGVFTGNEDPKNEKSGEKISDKKVADNGPQSGYIKKIKGKRLSPTYSNYISAKMRVPETYMEYWAEAPHPYSSVVAYTITQEGEVTDIQLVEGSEYPDMDLKTLQLIERLGPLMPPPDAKGDVRVTELFWNGPIDPNFVPTPLQKEMINLFDGRYMEEIPE